MALGRLPQILLETRQQKKTPHIVFKKDFYCKRFHPLSSRWATIVLPINEMITRL